ncbi:hypothetical protein BH11GEM2_BH11GEM2_01210 [soil metagenome]
MSNSRIPTRAITESRSRSTRVSQYARLAAERLALTDEEKHVACCAALLHDVGKVGVAVVDAYCAMLDRRSYKEAYPVARARAELLRCSGTQFDPVIVRAVLAAIREIDDRAPNVLTPRSVPAQPPLQALIQDMPFDFASG